MRSHVFLTPMTADGTAGEVKEIVYNEGPQMYAEPVPYWSANDAVLAKLKARVAEAETDLTHAISKNAPTLDIQRLESTLAGLKAELDQAEMPRREQRQRKTGIGRDDAPHPPSARQSLSALVASVSAAVAAIPTCKVTNTWDSFLADLDTRLAKRAFSGMFTPSPKGQNNNPTVCCAGQYLCSKCQATKAPLA